MGDHVMMDNDRRDPDLERLEESLMRAREVYRRILEARQEAARSWYQTMRRARDHVRPGGK
jgi:hypothetical protein